MGDNGMANNHANNASVTYPFNKDAIELSKNYNNGNYGLWFNKFIPISSGGKFRTCDENGGNQVVEYYKKFYDKNKNAVVNKLLEHKHFNQCCFCKSFNKQFEVFIITAELISPLITGIGQTHPNEVGMTFDHTLGIPYIPASSIKGIARFSHTLDLLVDLSNKHPDEIKKDKNNEEYFDDEAEWTHISKIFGKGGNKDNNGNIGNVIFLDAYPESVPTTLSVDIMNPHYGKYYSGKKPPADYLNPKPKKFLTVAKGTKFIFRYMINKAKSSELKELAKTALKKALTEEGVGAKTAVGYGLFKIEGCDELESVKKLFEKEEQERKEQERVKKIEELAQMKNREARNNMSEVEKICHELRNQYDESKATKIYRDLDSYNGEDKIKIAEALKEAYIKDGKWDKKVKSAKQEEKVKKIKSILNE